MLTDKRQILATAAVLAGIVMTAGTVVAEVAAQPTRQRTRPKTVVSAATGRPRPARAAHRGR